jgi:hypothetical protein
VDVYLFATFDVFVDKVDCTPYIREFWVGEIDRRDTELLDPKPKVLRFWSGIFRAGVNHRPNPECVKSLCISPKRVTPQKDRLIDRVPPIPAMQDLS